jgi:thymidine kinase
MKSGKSSALIGTITSAKYANKTYEVYYPSIDTRTTKNTITSRAGASCAAVPIDIDKIEDLLIDVLTKDIEFIFIDEVQFFDNTLLNTIKILLEYDKKIYVAGLLTNTNGDIFPTTAKLLAYADDVLQIKGICDDCGNPSTMIMRTIDGVMDETADIIIEGSVPNVYYHAVCVNCYLKNLKNKRSNESGKEE